MQLIFCVFVFILRYECILNEEKAIEKRDEIKQGFDELKKELDAFTGKMNPLNKHFPTDKNHVLVVIKMLTAESAGLCKLLTRYKRTRNDQIIKLKLLSNPYTKPFIFCKETG